VEVVVVITNQAGMAVLAAVLMDIRMELMLVAQAIRQAQVHLKEIMVAMVYLTILHTQTAVEVVALAQ
jgi:hypothetical protein